METLNGKRKESSYKARVVEETCIAKRWSQGGPLSCTIGRAACIRWNGAGTETRCGMKNGTGIGM